MRYQKLIWGGEGALKVYVCVAFLSRREEGPRILDLGGATSPSRGRAVGLLEGALQEAGPSETGMVLHNQEREARIVDQSERETLGLNKKQAKQRLWILPKST